MPWSVVVGASVLVFAFWGAGPCVGADVDACFSVGPVAVPVDGGAPAGAVAPAPLADGVGAGGGAVSAILVLLYSRCDLFKLGD